MKQQHLFTLLSSTQTSIDFTPFRPLPAPLAPLLGRQDEQTRLLTLLQESGVRLLTLTGPGGVGKTRLLLAVAHALSADFDTVCLVPLAAISDPEFVFPAIALALGLRDGSPDSILEEFQEIFSTQSLLLLLDNFEQVLDAATKLPDLLAVCPRLTILVTSRAPLRLYGEQEFPVCPLPLPDLKQHAAREALAQYAAITLFVERTQAIKPDFQMTDANAYTIAEICTRLDGLPLAIELAAVRMRLLSPQALLARLSHRLEVLTCGARNLPARQQTLRDTIAWSYHLLPHQGQKLFRWLAVCTGGCTLQAAEALALAAGLAADTILDEIYILVENHLLRQVQQSDGEPRLLLLETLREYGLECLQTCGELAAAQQAHAQQYLSLAQEAGPHLSGPEQVYWLDRLDREQENLRAVLQRATTGGDEEVEHALHLGTNLAWFWYVRGHASDGSRWLDWMQTERRGNTAVRARALNQAARLAIWRDEYALAGTLSSESLTLYREMGNIKGMAQALFWLGDATQDRSNYPAAHALYEQALALYKEAGDREGYAYALAAPAYGIASQGNFVQAQKLAEEALALFRTLGDKQGILYALVRLIRCLYFSQSDPSRARLLARESLALSREVGYKQGIAAALSYQGLLALQEGDTTTAQSRLEEAMQLRKELTSPWGIARGTYYLAGLSLAQRDYATASTRYETCLEMVREVGDREFLASCLEELAAVIVAWAEDTGQQTAHTAQYVWAGQLWGAAECVRESIGAPLPPMHRDIYEQALARVQKHLGVSVLREAWARGRDMTPEQVLAARPSSHSISRPAATTPSPLQLPAHPSGRASDRSPTPQPLASSVGLTAREKEVLRLVAQGLTNPQIAEQLVVSLPTINTHVASIFNKLGVNSRSAATRHAVERHLV